MGYNQNSNSHSGQCVKEVVRGIVRAQRKVAEAEVDNGSCTTSCERSIDELLSPTVERPSRPRHNTIPFMLYCKNSCKPFMGSGLIKTENGFYNCVESPVFRVKKFVGGSESCVIIELLEPTRRSRSNNDNISSNEGNVQQASHVHGGQQGCNCGCGGSVCQVLGTGIRSFRATGICITIDLNCFCGISCLDPITIR